MIRKTRIPSMALWCVVASLMSTTVARTHAQSLGCSDVVRDAAEAGIAADSTSPPFARELSRRDRVPAADSLVTREQLCMLGIIASFQNHRSGYTSIENVLQSLLERGKGKAELRYALAALRSQQRGATAVLTDTGMVSSTDPLVRFEIARALFLAGLADDAMNMLITSVNADVGAATLFHHATYPVLSADARMDLARTRSEERGRRLVDEWERMAWSSGLTSAERLAVHFKRIAHANSTFFGLLRPFADSSEVITSGMVQPDPRWEIYIRFGEPAQVVHTMNVARSSDFSSEYVTWVYADPTQRHPMLFHFTGVNSRYSLIANVGCMLDWLSDRATLSARIGQLYQACTNRSDSRQVIGQLARETHAAYRRNREREFVVPSKLAARFAYRLYTFSNPATKTLEVVAIAHVPAEAIPSGGKLRSGALLHSATIGTRSQFIDYDAPPSGDVIVTMTIPNVSAGDYTYRVRTSDPEFREGFVYGGEYTVRLGGAGELRMSDLVVAKERAPGALLRSGESLQPILGALTDRRFDLYGEAYGLAAGERVDVEITISGKRFLRRTTQVAVAFSDAFRDDGRFAFRQTIQHNLEPGEYDLTVTLHNEGAGAAQQIMTLQIR